MTDVVAGMALLAWATLPSLSLAGQEHGPDHPISGYSPSTAATAARFQRSHHGQLKRDGHHNMSELDGDCDHVHSVIEGGEPV